MRFSKKTFAFPLRNYHIYSIITRTQVQRALGCCNCPDLFRFFSTFFKIGGCQKKSRIQSLIKKLRFRGRTETFFTQDLVFVLFSATRWCYVKFLLLMSHYKIEHSLLILYIQKNFNTTSKTVYIYVFSLFFSELIVVNIDYVYVRENCNRNSI